MKTLSFILFLLSFPVHADDGPAAIAISAAMPVMEMVAYDGDDN